MRRTSQTRGMRRTRGMRKKRKYFDNPWAETTGIVKSQF
jgi:hypothetical protein